MARRDRDDYNWLDDPFDEKKAAREREQAARGGNGKAAIGCVVVLLALVVLGVFTLASGLSILSDL